MSKQISLEEDVIANWQDTDDGTKQLLPDLASKQLAIVNVAFYGAAGAGDRQWVLIDAGITGTTGMIRRAAHHRFGEHSRPAAIILTHGHFDHIGGLKTLLDEWDVDVYAHVNEHPFLNGTTSYPPSDPLVGGGLMPLTGPLMPRGPIDVSTRLKALPADGSVPFMPDWIWLATPGHSPGHISLWRESDHTLIAGDAVITTRQESVYAVATQEPELHGPPQYFTPDWARARESALKLAELEPELIISGHGQPMRGETMRAALHELADNFSDIAVPAHGKYGPNSSVAPSDARA